MKSEKQIRKEIIYGDAFMKIWQDVKPKHQGGYWQCWYLALEWVLKWKK